MSPSDPPLGADVLTVLVPLAFVPAVAEIKACTLVPIATPKLVLDVPLLATSSKFSDSVSYTHLTLPTIYSV